MAPTVPGVRRPGVSDEPSDVINAVKGDRMCSVSGAIITDAEWAAIESTIETRVVYRAARWREGGIDRSGREYQQEMPGPVTIDREPDNHPPFDYGIDIPTTTRFVVVRLQKDQRVARTEGTASGFGTCGSRRVAEFESASALSVKRCVRDPAVSGCYDRGAVGSKSPGSMSSSVGSSKTDAALAPPETTNRKRRKKRRNKHRGKVVKDPTENTTKNAFYPVSMEDTAALTTVGEAVRTAKAQDGGGASESDAGPIWTFFSKKKPPMEPASTISGSDASPTVASEDFQKGVEHTDQDTGDPLRADKIIDGKICQGPRIERGDGASSWSRQPSDMLILTPPSIGETSKMSRALPSPSSTGVTGGKVHWVDAPAQATQSPQLNTVPRAKSCLPSVGTSSNMLISDASSSKKELT